MSNLSVRFPAPFPATVAGAGGISVEKENGVWTIAPDFSTLSEILPAALSDPSSKKVWLYDPVVGTYNVLSLAGLGDALFRATSTSSVTVGTGTKTFIIQPGKDFAAGSFVLATSDGDPANYMLGQISAYAGTALTIDVADSGVGGVGTHSDWTLRASSPTGAQGPAGPGYAAQSSTSATIGTGSKSFVVQAGLAYSAGARVRASSSANGANYMEGLVASYSGTTLIVDMTVTGGSGTFADWSINLAGNPGSGDLTSTSNLSDLASPKSGFDTLNVYGSPVASAATVDLDAASGVLVDVTGSTTITAVTLAAGRERVVRFAQGLTLTHSSTLELPGSLNIATAPGDFAVLRGYPAGVVRCIAYTRANGQPLTTGFGTVSAAATTNLASTTTEAIDVVGSATISSFGSAAPVGAIKFVRFQAATTITHNATSLIIPGGASLSLSANDAIIVRHEGTGNWRVISCMQAAGRPLNSAVADTLSKGFSAASFAAGTKSSGTFTPVVSDGNFQHATNGGPHSLAPPSTVCSLIIEYTNNASAGVIVTSSFTKVTGDAFTTTNGHKFVCYIVRTNSFSHLHVQGLQ